MDTKALTLCRSEMLEPLPVSKDEMLVDKLIPADVESPLGKTRQCCHFTIRGYVADLRKSGRKFCGPLSDGLGMTSKVLLPITVAKFRWWECPSCSLQTRQTDKLEDDIRHLSIEDGKRDISSEGSQLGVTCTGPPIQLDTPYKTSSGTVPQIAEADPKDLIDSGKSDPSLCGYLNNRDPGVNTFRKDEDSDIKEDVSKTTAAPSHQAATSETHEVVQKTTYAKRFVFKLKRKTSLTGLCGSETPDMVSAVLSAENATNASRRMDANCPSSISKEKLQCSSSVNHSTDKEDVSESDTMVHISELVSQRMNSPNCEASMEETLSETSNIDSCKIHLDLVDGNLNRKRTHKTRLLSDILNSGTAKEDSVLAQKEDMEAEGYSVLSQNKVIDTKEDSGLLQNEIIEEQNNSNREILQGHVGAVEEQVVKTIESKKRSRLSEIEEGSSPLCILKRKIKKAKGVKIDADCGIINCPDTNSEQKAGEMFSKPVGSEDSIHHIKKRVTYVGKRKKQHAKGKIEIVQKGLVQIKQLKDAIQNSVPEGSALETKHRESYSYPSVDACSKGTEHTGKNIGNELNKKVKGMDFDTKMNNVNSAGINAEQSTEFTSSKPLYPIQNLSSVERENTADENDRKKIKRHGIKDVSGNLAQMNHPKDAPRDCIPQVCSKSSKYIASHLKHITDSGSNVHTEMMVNNEQHEKCTLKPHNMAVSNEETECRVNSKTLQKETAIGAEDIADSPKKRTTEPLHQKGGTDSVDGIPVEILKLLQDNWKKRHKGELQNVEKHTYKMSEKRTDKMPDLTSDACDRLSAGFCHDWKNKHSQWMNHHSQYNPSGLGKAFLSASPLYLPGPSSCCMTDISNDVSRNENAYYHKSTGGLSSGQRTCNDQTKVIEKGHVHDFGQEIESSPFTKESGNGLGFPFVDTGRFCLPENQSVAEPMTNTCGITQISANQVPCGGCNSNLPGAFDFGQHRRLASRFIHMDTLINDHGPTTNHTRKEDDRLKDMDATVQLHGWKHVAHLRASEENHSIYKLSNQGAATGYHVNVMPEVDIGRHEVVATNRYNEKVMPPVDNHRNEAISAMNLLRLMDSGARSFESPGTSKNRNVGESLNVSHTYHYGESLWLGSNDRNFIENRQKQPSEFLCQHQSRNFSYLYRPDARIGVPVALPVNNRMTNIDSAMSPFTYADGRIGPQGRNFLTSQKASPVGFSFSTTEDSKASQTPNLAAQLPLSHKLGHVSHVGGKTKILQPTESRTDICVLNRNPADFTVPDGNNDYMIQYTYINSRLCCLREDVPQVPLISSVRRKQ